MTTMLKTKRWILAAIPEVEQSSSLASALNIHSSLASILWQRGMTHFDAAKAFFLPSLSQIHDPFLMKDMDKAVERLQTALIRQEKIMILGDYDVDGTTSVALVFGYLSKYYPLLYKYIPDRYGEGYGVSMKSIEQAKEWDCSVIITLDCGIKAHAPIAFAAKKGIDVIVCDHHNPPEILPKAYAVLDPKRTDCAYPYKELSGCGVGFKLMQALTQKQAWPAESLEDLLPLLAISICADIVSMTGENRIFTFFGLQKINTKPSFGIAALIKTAKLNKALVVRDVVFGLAPRINAAGRIHHGMAAVDLLLAQSEEESMALAEGLDIHNTDRRSFDQSITQEALAEVAADPNFQEAYSTVVFKKDWHKGVIGIVASRLIEQHYKPTIVLTENQGKLTGSARSVAGFDIHEAIEACSEHLEQFGGHAFAAGLTLKMESLTAFKDAFEKQVRARLKEEQRLPCLEIDLILNEDVFGTGYSKVIDRMQPFGPQHPEPTFATYHASVKDVILLKEEHLKMKVQFAQGGNWYPAIAFQRKEDYAWLLEEKKAHIAFHLQENHYQDQVTLQWMVKDLKSTRYKDL